MQEKPQAAGGSGKSVPPSVLLMQQNTRLVILTLEVLADSGAQLRLPDAPQQPARRQDSSAQQPQQPAQRQDSAAQQLQQRAQRQDSAAQQPQQPLSEMRLGPGAEQPAVVPAAGGAAGSQADSGAAAGGNLDPVGYVAAFPAGGGAPASPRPAAVRLLMCYMGAMLRSRASAAAFVDSAAACYRCAGQGARQLHAWDSKARSAPCDMQPLQTMHLPHQQCSLPSGFTLRHCGIAWIHGVQSDPSAWWDISL
jgi:hypothetical protein